jgi:phosphatidylcholine synthase
MSTSHDILERLDRRALNALRVCAWGVHLYTALGLILAGTILWLLVSGRETRFELAFVLMLVATLIDATDGFLARGVRVKEVLPGFDGRRLDDITDFLNYVFLPLFLIYQAQLLAPGQEAWLLLPLVSAAYGFCQVSAKTEDGFFLGFPSYWNLIAFYLYALNPPQWFALAAVIVFSLLTFVPMRYLYPTQPGRLNKLSLALGIVWGVLLVVILWGARKQPLDGDRAQRLISLSLFYPLYYLLASWTVSARYWLLARRRAHAAHVES